MIDSLIQIFVLLGAALWPIVSGLPAKSPSDSPTITPAVAAAVSTILTTPTPAPTPTIVPSAGPQFTLTPAPQKGKDTQADDCDFNYHYDSNEDPTFYGRVRVNVKCLKENQNNSTSTVKTNADINTGSSSGDVKVDISVKNKIGN